MHLQKQEPLGSGCPALWRARRAASFIHTTVCVPGHSTISSLSDGTLKWRDSGSVSARSTQTLPGSTIQKRWFAVPKESSALHLTGFTFHITKPTRRESDYQTWTARSSGSALRPARLPPVDLLQVRFLESVCPLPESLRKTESLA